MTTPLRLLAPAALLAFAAPASAATEVDMDGAFAFLGLVILGLYIGGAFLLALLVHLAIRWRWWTVLLTTIPAPAALWIAMAAAFHQRVEIDLGYVAGFIQAMAAAMMLALLGAIPGTAAGSHIRRKAAPLFARGRSG